MKNIILVLQREYLTRVRKKSFIVMTLLAPFLVSGFYGVAIYAGISSIDVKKVEVIDESQLFDNKIHGNKQITFNFISTPLANAKTDLKKSGFDALVFIPQDLMENPNGVKIFAEKGVSLDLKSNIEEQIEKRIEEIKLTEAGLTQKVLESIKANVHSETISLSDGGEKKSDSTILTILGGLCAMLIYITVIVYGAQVMRSVVEEKTSRIIEVIISSVKPFQLMMGKIIGVALVGLTQFVLWILLTLAVTSILPSFAPSKLSQQMPVNQQMEKVAAKNGQAAPQIVKSPTSGLSSSLDALNNLPKSQIALIIGCFLFYFLGGYLLYSSLFGAVGSAVDSETDTQQFMFPLTLPIIFSFIIAQFVMMNPDGNLAFWTSIIPFTSPIIMMVRIPFGVPAWQIILSMVLLIAGFISTTWVAARIYRVGILMYGKKVTFKELGKWIFYKG